MTKPRLRAFLRVYGATGSVAAAARAARIARSTHFRRLKSDAAYRAAIEMCEQELGAMCEEEAIRRAVAGTEKPVYQGGQMVGTVQEYSDTLLIRLLERFKRAQYKPPAEKSDDARFSCDVLMLRINEARARVGIAPDA